MRKWEPSASDAVSIATFRWFANQLENEALELYMTDRRHFAHIERVLRQALKEMGNTREKARISEEEDGCPDGWVLCDGICKPSCDALES